MEHLLFGDGAGDHYAFMVDIDKVSVFGADGVPSEKLKARQVKLSDPRIIARSFTLIHKFYTKHKLYLKVHHLNRVPVQYPIQYDLAEKYEEIYDIRVKGMKHSEKDVGSCTGGEYHGALR